MGYWNVHPMAGDPPMDAMGAVEEIFFKALVMEEKTGEVPGGDRERFLFNNHLTEIISACREALDPEEMFVLPFGILQEKWFLTGQSPRPSS